MVIPDWLRSPDLNLDDAVITLDADGLVVGLNEEAVRLGLDGDPHGKPLEATFPIRDEFSGQEPNGRTRTVILPTKGGELRAFDLVAIPHGGVRGWTVLLRPVIASGDTEHESWANLSKTSKEGTGLGDPTTGRIGLVSNSFAALHGYTPDEMLGLSVSALFPNDGEGMAQMEERLLAGAVSWETRHRRKDGSTFPVLMSVTTVRNPLGEVRFRAMRVEDITERKKIEDALQESEGRMASLVASATEYAILTTDLEGRITLWNPGAQTIYGYVAEEIVGRSSDLLFTPEDLRRRAPERERRLAIRDGRAIDERWHLRRDGSRFYGSGAVTPLFRDDELVGYVKITRDLTERREADLARRGSAARDVFRLALADALRLLDDPALIEAVTTRLLAEHLRVGRAIYATIGPDGAARVESEYTQGSPSLVGSRRAIAFDAESVARLEQGETLVVGESAAKSGTGAKGVAASLTVPLLREGRLVALIGAHSEEARDWRDDEIGLITEASERMWGTVERVRAEAALRESETRQSFLLRLSDAVRSLDDPIEIQETLTRTVMEHFGADRCYYGEVKDGQAIVLRDARRGDLPSVAGVYALDRFAVFQAAVMAGRPFVVRNVHTSDLIDEEFRRQCLELSVIGFINVPIVKNDEVVGMLFLVQSAPRDWTGLELELVAEAAERTWVAVERARAETALRESEARLAVVFEALPIGVGVLDPEGAMVLANREMQRFLPSGAMPSQDEVRGWRWKAWDAVGRPMPPSEFPGVRALGGESVIPGIEMRHTREDGAEIWVRVASVPLRDAEGRVTGAFIVITDIDALKRTTGAHG